MEGEGESENDGDVVGVAELVTLSEGDSDAVKLKEGPIDGRSDMVTSILWLCPRRPSGGGASRPRATVNRARARAIQIRMRRGGVGVCMSSTTFPPFLQAPIPNTCEFSYGFT